MKLAGLIRSSSRNAILAAIFAEMPLGVAQNSPPTTSIPAKPLAFEVISIHPSKPGTNGTMTLAITPDGYSVTGQSMAATIMIAYFPQGAAYWSRDRLSGAPAWLSDQYDINAKVSEGDLAEWQKQGNSLDKKPMFQQMLQSMLADRCHFVAHMVPGPPISGWAIELGKHALHLTESNPGETLPAGMKFPDGGVMVSYRSGDKGRFTFYAATMSDLGQVLSSSGHPVQDHTGLTGHYDFAIDWAGDPNSKLPGHGLAADDPNQLSLWDFDPLGLRVVPIEVPLDTLVIDHIEKPSEN